MNRNGETIHRSVVCLLCLLPFSKTIMASFNIRDSKPFNTSDNKSEFLPVVKEILYWRTCLRDDCAIIHTAKTCYTDLVLRVLS